jgi:hypothetical protein
VVLRRSGTKNFDWASGSDSGRVGSKLSPVWVKWVIRMGLAEVGMGLEGLWVEFWVTWIQKRDRTSVLMKEIRMRLRWRKVFVDPSPRAQTGSD